MPWNYTKFAKKSLLNCYYNTKDAILSVTKAAVFAGNTTCWQMSLTEQIIIKSENGKLMLKLSTEIT